MDFSQAQEAFCKLKSDIKDEKVLADFFHWIQSAFLVSHCRGEGPAIAHHELSKIAEEIRKMLPTKAILPSETIHRPIHQDASIPTTHMDAFLYDDMDIDELVEQGKLSRNYCKDCGSLNTAPVEFETHSASINRLDFIFSTLVPWIPDQVVLDVGSRVGAVLYGAYHYSKAKKIIGVEMNEELCGIQRKIIEKKKLDDRIQVVCADIRKVPRIVEEANVVVVNNTFECFLDDSAQRECWQFLSKHVQPGSKLVTSPALTTAFKHLPAPPPVDLDSWVKRIPIEDPLVAMSMRDQDELSEIVCYEVLSKL